MKVKSGYSFYGANIGIIVFDGIAPRIPGDAGNGKTFPFPVHYEIVKGCFKELSENNAVVKENLLNCVELFHRKGIRGVAGDCGLMGIYQQEMAAKEGLVAASSLCQIPFIWQLIGRTGKIGIITGHSDLLNSEILSENGCDDIPIVIQGMEKEKHFRHIVIEGNLDLDPGKMEEDTIHAVACLLEGYKDIKAIVLECSNLASYSHSISQTFNLPVFDIVSAIYFMEYGLNPPVYDL